jgi:hypothetical protein
MHTFYVSCPVFDIYDVSGSRMNAARRAYHAEPKVSNVLNLLYLPLPIYMMVNCYIFGIVVPFLYLMIILDPCAEGWIYRSFWC